MNEQKAREIVRRDHCPTCGTQRCDSSDEMMEGCGHLDKLLGRVSDLDKVLAAVNQEYRDKRYKTGETFWKYGEFKDHNKIYMPHREVKEFVNGIEEDRNEVIGVMFEKNSVVLLTRK